MSRRIAHLALLLGLITAVGPFAIDIYLPALPTLGASLHASPARVQMSLTVFFVIVGVCQLFYGPVSDVFGRKPPIYAGLVIFAVASVGCALAPTIETLIAFRALQAFGACAGMVIPRAIVRDLYTGHEAAKLMSLLMLVMSVSPILAPLAGSLVISLWSWREVFAVLAVLALACLVMTIVQLPETHPAERRLGKTLGSAFSSYGALLRDPVFIGLSVVCGFGLATFFVFIGSAPFVYIEHYGLTPTQFSLAFALNAASFFAMSQLTARLSARFGLAPLILWSVAAVAAVMAVLAVTTLWVDSLALTMALLFIGFGFLGLLLPAAGVLSLEDHGAVAGSASALLGAIQMIIGALSMTLIGVFADHTPAPMLIGIALCAIAAMFTTVWTLRRLPAHLASAPPSS
ncbi:MULTISPECIES: multidrug effflux MFS transporter [Pseudomonas]|jgi:DHA1 family bicyclomycin/chloramphenicol resistance-like MFS transporter|uniref:Bcr/CflA family efflux transporter n=1 Tax=Pseudomonas extremorientalis TaxID=169669 RepID=A0A1H0J4J3_9PSED|nr:MULTISPECIES: multidrug effflux MFS transporter [Pseudomonas]KAB0515542.1 multidrug effflux MFS transporter [Pseudomonas extremorientalis]OIN12577.1 Bcr/CflA family drug resistance efflux transporter [Pseudomonas extremorientalis]QZP18861.1 multidrug effflux MFS transporter [Pseudomonas sp. DR208]UUN86036.1 multidrug effflux MFS transporter [Pseudomonas extremorientalis]WLG59673.1 multidrug effflux MFS transporter [Pseudomonas extremorientalis]